MHAAPDEHRGGLPEVLWACTCVLIGGAFLAENHGQNQRQRHFATGRADNKHGCDASRHFHKHLLRGWAPSCQQPRASQTQNEIAEPHVFRCMRPWWTRGWLRGGLVSYVCIHSFSLCGDLGLCSFLYVVDEENKWETQHALMSYSLLIVCIIIWLLVFFVIDIYISVCVCSHRYVPTLHPVCRFFSCWPGDCMHVMSFVVMHDHIPWIIILFFLLVLIVIHSLDGIIHIFFICVLYSHRYASSYVQLRMLGTCMAWCVFLPSSCVLCCCSCSVIHMLYFYNHVVFDGDGGSNYFDDDDDCRWHFFLVVFRLRIEWRLFFAPLFLVE